MGRHTYANAKARHSRWYLCTCNVTSGKQLIFFRETNRENTAQPKLLLTHCGSRNVAFRAGNDFFTHCVKPFVSLYSENTQRLLLQHQAVLRTLRQTISWYVQKDVYHNYRNISSPVDCCHDVSSCDAVQTEIPLQQWDIGNDPALVATADAFDMGASPHRWGRSCAKLAGSSSLKRHFFHQKLTRHDLRWAVVVAAWNGLVHLGEVTRRVGPEEKHQSWRPLSWNLISRCLQQVVPWLPLSVYVQEPCHIFPFFSIGSSQVESPQVSRRSLSHWWDQEGDSACCSAPAIFHVLLGLATLP